MRTYYFSAVVALVWYGILFLSAGFWPYDRDENYTMLTLLTASLLVFPLCRKAPSAVERWQGRGHSFGRFCILIGHICTGFFVWVDLTAAHDGGAIFLAFFFIASIPFYLLGLIFAVCTDGRVRPLDEDI